MALQIGETAPDFEAETTEGWYRFHPDRRFVGRPVFPPARLHACLHNGARVLGGDQAGVRPA